MDVRAALLRGQSKALTDKIVAYTGNNQSRFNDLIAMLLDDNPRLVQRVAWPLSYCVRNHPKLLNPHFSSVLKIARKSGVHDGVKRNIMRLLQFVDIPKRFQGKAVAVCFELMDTHEPIAVRVFAMTVLANIAKQQPGLKNELTVIIEDQLPYGSAGFVSRGRKILRELKK